MAAYKKIKMPDPLGSRRLTFFIAINYAESRAKYLINLIN